MTDHSPETMFMLKITELGLYSGFLIYLPVRPQVSKLISEHQLPHVQNQAVTLGGVGVGAKQVSVCSTTPRPHQCSTNHHHHYYHVVKLTFGRHLKFSNKNVILLSLLK